MDQVAHNASAPVGRLVLAKISSAGRPTALRYSTRRPARAPRLPAGDSASRGRLLVTETQSISGRDLISHRYAPFYWDCHSFNCTGLRPLGEWVCRGSLGHCLIEDSASSAVGNLPGKAVSPTLRSNIARPGAPSAHPARTSRPSWPALGTWERSGRAIQTSRG